MTSRKIHFLPVRKLIKDLAEISHFFCFFCKPLGRKNKSTSPAESGDVNIRRHFVRLGLPCHIVAISVSVTIGLHEICGLISVAWSPIKLWRVWAVWGCLVGMTGGDRVTNLIPLNPWRHCSAGQTEMRSKRLFWPRRGENHCFDNF